MDTMDLVCHGPSTVNPDAFNPLGCVEPHSSVSGCMEPHSSVSRHIENHSRDSGHIQNPIQVTVGALTFSGCCHVTFICQVLVTTSTELEGIFLNTSLAAKCFLMAMCVGSVGSVGVWV